MFELKVVHDFSNLETVLTNVFAKFGFAQVAVPAGTPALPTDLKTSPELLEKLHAGVEPAETEEQKKTRKPRAPKAEPAAAPVVDNAPPAAPTIADKIPTVAAAPVAMSAPVTFPAPAAAVQAPAALGTVTAYPPASLEDLKAAGLQCVAKRQNGPYLAIREALGSPVASLCDEATRAFWCACLKAETETAGAGVAMAGRGR